MKRIAIVGASGFVGASLAERLLSQGGDEVVPFIHSSGNAWRLARLDIELKTLNLLDRDQVHAALRGVTHVVNCSRGGGDVMLKGLRNLLSASRMLRIDRFIHLSSVAVYGDPPSPESSHENAPTNPLKGSYGWIKLMQDRMVEKACQEGQPSVILCPPNISGPHSAYLVALVDVLRLGRFALLEEGTAPCNLVDVDNLTFAVELALRNGPADGARMFVTDDEDTNWGRVVERLSALVDTAPPVPRVNREQLLPPDAVPRGHTKSLLGSLRHVVSADVRQALRKDPLWEKVDGAVRRSIAWLGKGVEGRLRFSVEGPIKICKTYTGPQLDLQLCRQQLRGVRHSCAVAKAQLGYRPIHSFGDSMKAFCEWYRHQHGMDSHEWDLIRNLY